MTRRELLIHSMSAAGALGFRSLLLGLPPSFLTQRAMANTPKKFLVYVCSQAGEPVNVNAPGTYINGAMHSSAWRNPVPMRLGSYNTQGAAIWAGLPQDLLDQMNFIHHDTKTNSHGENENVLRVQGALKSASNNGSEMLPSAIAQMTADSLGTLNSKPILVGNVGSSVTYNSVPLPVVSPGSIRGLFTTGNQNTTGLRRFRDQAIDELYQDVKTNGTPAQMKFLDDHATSASQARNMATQFLTSLDGLGVSSENDQMIAAAALIAANVSPAIIAKMNFGGDNHSSNGGDSAEIAGHNASIPAINTLYQKLKEFGKADQTVFCLQGGVFGRTTGRLSGTRWRNHNGAHTVAVVFGNNINGGVTGGLDPATASGSGACTGINSVTGSSSNADVPRSQTLSSMAKTLMSACGIASNDINDRMTEGKILASVLK